MNPQSKSPFTPHVEGESRNLDAPAVIFDLGQESAAVKAGEAFTAAGHSAKTLVKAPDLRVVMMVFQAGSRLAEHRATGRITIHTLVGHVQVRVDGALTELPAGALLTLGPSIPHDVEAVEESTILLTLAARAT